jgi:Rrf2 family nitric oxide-sensitive transcriptional repressor
MKLTSYSAYALRSLQLAALKTPNLVRIKDVAKIHNHPRPHIMKIVHELGTARYLDIARGRGSGFRLARPPEKIFDDVIRTRSQKMQEATAASMAVLGDLAITIIASNGEQLMTRIAPLELSRTRKASQ